MATDMFCKANEEFLADNYVKALELYTSAIEESDCASDTYYVNRAHTHIKLNSFLDAVKDCDKAIELNPHNSVAYLRKGMAQFNLDNYQSAKDTLIDGQKLDPDNANIHTWIKKCEDILPKSEINGTTSPLGDVNTVENIKESSPKIRHDWYQTQSHVVVTILSKNVQKDDLTVDISERAVNVTLKLSTTNDYVLCLKLSHEIVPDDCQTRILPSKIEVKLKKKEGYHWQHLERDDDSHIKQISTAGVPSTKAPSYPSSSLQPRNWDKIVSDIKEEEKKEEPEGDAALNQLFQKIYADGSDETRKAMNKSFSESGGTVLSTNWKDIGDKKTEIKPPDGMEFKKY